MQIIFSHVLNRVKHNGSWHLISTISIHSKVTLRLELILAVAERPQVIHVVLSVVETILCPLDDLVLLHLRQSFHLIALILTQDTISDALCSYCCIVRHLIHTCTTRILILTVALDTLHIKVAAIETISQVIHIVQ